MCPFMKISLVRVVLYMSKSFECLRGSFPDARKEGCSCLVTIEIIYFKYPRRILLTDFSSTKKNFTSSKIEHIC